MFHSDKVYGEEGTVNVLCLDGGGVRGLSTLLILKKLLCLVNVEIHNGQPGYDKIPRRPSEIFDIVVGTSTGGLIAIMLVKLAMDVDACIMAYKSLSEEIFGRPHRRAWVTGGFGSVKKYCGRRLRHVLVKKVIEPTLDKNAFKAENLKMEEVDDHVDFHCAVVCRELDRDTGARKDDPVFLCSEQCRPHDANSTYRPVKVADAARATSAAPTYFSPVDVIGKRLVDGGYGATNNPSFEATTHFFRRRERYHQIDIVNLGTGSKSKWDKTHKPRRHLIQYLPSRLITGIASVLKDLAEMATESDKVGTLMELVAEESTRIKFSRFSANRRGISCIRLGEYEKLETIEDATNEYLNTKKVSDDLQKLARQLAAEYKARQRRRHNSGYDLLSQQRERSSLDISPVRPPHPQTELLQVPEQGPGLTDSSSLGDSSPVTDDSSLNHTNLPLDSSARPGGVIPEVQIATADNRPERV